jgi:hypothetical protein
MTDLLNVLSIKVYAHEDSELCCRTLVLTAEDQMLIIYSSYYNIKKFYIVTQYRSSVGFS